MQGGVGNNGYFLPLTLEPWKAEWFGGEKLVLAADRLAWTSTPLCEPGSDSSSPRGCFHVDTQDALSACFRPIKFDTGVDLAQRLLCLPSFPFICV